MKENIVKIRAAANILLLSILAIMSVSNVSAVRYNSMYGSFHEMSYFPTGLPGDGEITNISFYLPVDATVYASASGSFYFYSNPSSPHAAISIVMDSPMVPDYATQYFRGGGFQTAGVYNLTAGYHVAYLNGNLQDPTEIGGLTMTLIVEQTGSTIPGPFGAIYGSFDEYQNYPSGIFGEIKNISFHAPEGVGEVGVYSTASGTLFNNTPDVFGAFATMVDDPIVFYLATQYNYRGGFQAAAVNSLYFGNVYIRDIIYLTGNVHANSEIVGLTNAVIVNQNSGSDNILGKFEEVKNFPDSYYGEISNVSFNMPYDGYAYITASGNLLDNGKSAPYAEIAAMVDTTMVPDWATQYSYRGGFQTAGTYKLKSGNHVAYITGTMNNIPSIQGLTTAVITKRYGNIGSELPGDADGSDTITTADALLYLRSSVGQDIAPYSMSVAHDVTCDGKITVADALLVLRKSVGQGVSLQC
jgi:hypothetical protein